MAKDFFHPHVRAALEKDGWQITHDPYYLTIDEISYPIDLGAEPVIGAAQGPLLTRYLLLPAEAGADLGLVLSPIQRMAFMAAAALAVLVFTARLISAESKARQMGLFLYVFVALLILALFAVVAGQGGTP